MKLLLIFSSLAYLLSVAFGNCGDGSWVPYESEKCFKILNPIEIVTRAEAVDLCAQQQDVGGHIPVLPMIKSPAEQAFLTKYLFQDTPNFDSAWLGARRHNESAFVWDDGTEFVYSHWETDRPLPDYVNSCLQINSRVSKDGPTADEDGLWRDVPCGKRNLVVCQKLQTLTLKELQDLVFEMKNNPVPLGFLYTEYPNQPSPQDMWPNQVWQDITVQYAGLFFRAVGDNSAPFGVIQEGTSPRLAAITFAACITGEDCSPDMASSISVPADGSVSVPLQVGHYDAALYSESLTFRHSDGEVRPTNMAVRIWKRI